MQRLLTMERQAQNVGSVTTPQIAKCKSPNVGGIEQHHLGRWRVIKAIVWVGRAPTAIQANVHLTLGCRNELLIHHST